MRKKSPERSGLSIYLFGYYFIITILRVEEYFPLRMR